MSTRPDDVSADGRAVLVHLAAGIGNLVFATPLLAALHRLGYEVDLLLHADYPRAAELFAGWSAVRRVHARVFPHGARYAHILPAVPPFYWTRLRSIYGGGRIRGCVPRPPDRLFWRDEQGWYLAFAEPLGWPRGERPAYTVPVAPDESRGVTRSTLVLAPGCKTGEMTAKRWPHFAALAGRFADVAVVGTEDDLRGHDGAPMAFPAHVRSLVGALSLRETAEVMAAAGVVVANDSGLGHLAGATGVPTLLLFGPTADAILGPFPPNVTVLRGGLPCEPCWNGPRLRACAGRVDCLQALAADRVEREVRALLGMGTGDREMVIAPAAVATWPVAGDGVASEEIVAGRDENRDAPEDSARPDHPLAIPVFPSSDDPADGDPSIPFVSCLMPTRDRRRFVAHAVEQFLRQDHPRRELVVVDDGTDPVADLVPSDPRVRYHRVERQRTLGGKRNLACRLARGDLLAHWDDDDWMPPHRLSAQVRALANVPRAEACGLAHIRFFDPAAERAWEYRWPERSRPWVAGGTLLFRRRLWERHPFPELNEGEDTRWVWSLPLGTLAAIPDPGLYAALVHTGNTSRKRTGDSRWHPIPLEVVRGAMGDDWSFYAAPSPAPRRVPA